VSEALERVRAVLDRHERLAIAVSGGVDSMTLAHVATRHSKTRATMYHATSPAVPASAGERVHAHAARHGWRLVVVDAAELADARYRANPVDRCYYCKSDLYGRIAAVTNEPIASGTNRDDLRDYRPGLRAASEHAVVHPYVEASLAKSDIYMLAATLGLHDLERLPAQPCLASRVETGIAIDAADLAFIDAVEARLASAVGREATVRCRITHSGVVVEVADSNHAAAAREIAESACRAEGRAFVSVRPYARGAAFLRKVVHAG
jgi:uncharacterized protein